MDFPVGAIPAALAEVEKQFHGVVPSDEEVAALVGVISDGTRMIGQRKVSFTAQFAERFLLLSKLVGDRNLTDAGVTKIIYTLLNKRAYKPERVDLVTCLCLEDGIVYRVNGQHTCWARIAVAERCPLWVGGTIEVSEYEAKTLEDVKQLYTIFDQNKGRNDIDKVRALVAGAGSFTGHVDNKLLTLVASGMAFWMWEQKHERQLHTGNETAQIMLSRHRNLVEHLTSFYRESGDRSGRCVCRVPVYAAMYATFDRAVAKSNDFWSCVRDGTGVEKGDIDDPKLRLRNSLLGTAVNTSNKKEIRSITQEEMYRLCINAWNAFRDGRKIKSLRAPLDCPRPKAK